MAAMAAPAWTPTDTGHQEQVPAEVAEAASHMGLLLAHLTPAGRGTFFGEMKQAMESGSLEGPDSVAWVVERWLRTLAIRHNPEYAANMASVGTRSRRQTTEELLAEVERMRAE